MDKAEKQKLKAAFKELEEDIRKLWREDKEFRKETDELFSLQFKSSKEKQKFIDSHPKKKEFQNRKMEIKKMCGV